RAAWRAPPLRLSVASCGRRFRRAASPLDVGRGGGGAVIVRAADRRHGRRRLARTAARDEASQVRQARRATARSGCGPATERAPAVGRGEKRTERTGARAPAFAGSSC